MTCGYFFISLLRNQKVSYIFVTIRFHIAAITMHRDVFKAIADPTRREIINLIAHQSMNLNAVADNFDMSRPAVSKHIKILTECGLLVIKQQGRERFCKADLKQLKEVTDWAEQYRRFWTQKLDALDVFLTNEQNTESINPKNEKL